MVSNPKTVEFWLTLEIPKLIITNFKNLKVEFEEKKLVTTSL